MLRSEMAAADTIYLASDLDREGEAIAQEILRLVPPGKRWKRVRFPEITEDGIAAGLREAEDGLEMPKVEASATRRVIDRLAGWHATKLIFEKVRQHKGLSGGRLQSAALVIVCDRHRENTAFSSKTTFTVRCKAKGGGGEEIAATLLDSGGKPQVFEDEPSARACPAPTRLTVGSVKIAQKEQKPLPPFVMATWLQVASKALGMKVAEATKAAQALYEEGAITYHRTDTVRVSEGAIAWARAELLRRYGQDMVPPSPWDHKDRGAGKKQDAHEALRPAAPTSGAELGAGARAEWGAAFDLVERRFLASQAAARLVEQVTVLFTDDRGRTWKAAGQVELRAGWKKVMVTDAAEERDEGGEEGGEEDGAGGLRALAEGTDLALLGTDVAAHTTKPRPLFNQASLVAELERRGIGRPSTYHTVVPVLTGRGWVEEVAVSPKKKKRTEEAESSSPNLPGLVPTEAGKDLCEFLKRALPGMVNLGWTAALEAALDDIAEGKRSRPEVAKEWWTGFAAELQAAASLPVTGLERPDLGPCPKCAREGRAGHLRLIRGKTKEGRAFEFAGCDADTRDSKVCGQTGRVVDGKLELERPDLGPCPKCAREGRAGHLRLIRGKSAEGKEFEFAGCDLDREGARPCGETRPTFKGAMLKELACPSCKKPMKAVTKKDGAHSYLCEGETLWFLAGKTWELAKAPSCEKCQKPLVHRSKKEAPGEFFWACFDHKVFLDSDKWGAVKKSKR